jgi:hypothetical protein
VSRGDVLVRAGAVVFAVGAVAVLAVVVPFFFGHANASIVLNLLTLLLPLGLALALLGLLRGARSSTPSGTPGSSRGRTLP